MDAIRSKVAQFRTSVNQILPYFTGYVYGMIATPKPGIGTMAVDEQARLYYDPAFVERLDIKAGRFVVCHEALHVALNHAPMARRMLGDRPTAAQMRAWNLAADCVVNQILSPWLGEAPSEAVLGGKLVTHTELGLPPSLTVPQYYALLMQQHEQKQKQNNPGQRGTGKDGDSSMEDDDDEDEDGDVEGSGSCDRDDRDEEPEAPRDRDRGQPADGECDDDDDEDGDPSDGEGGEHGDEGSDGDDGDDTGEGDAERDAGRDRSGSDGKADREDVREGGGDSDEADGETEWPGFAGGGSGADGQPRGYEEKPDSSWKDREYSLTDMLESRIEEAESSAPGSVPGCLKEAVGLRLRPQADPFDVLRATVARAVATPVGAPDYTLRKFSRRQQADGPRLRGVTKETPNCVVILDTSGSMQGDRVTRAIDVIAKAVRRLKSVKVVCYDADLHGRRTVTSMGSFQWQGGGGTDMGRAIEQVDKEDRPDAIVLVTDLETPWPERMPRARVVVAAVDAKPYWLERVPGWAKLCDLSKGGA